MSLSHSSSSSSILDHRGEKSNSQESASITTISEQSHPGSLDGEQTPAMNSACIMQRARSHALGVMAKHIFDDACNFGLIRKDESTASDRSSVSSMSRKRPMNVVALRAAKHQYAMWPTTESSEVQAFLSSLSSLNVGAAMTIQNAVTEGLIELLSHDSHEVILSVSNRVQVVESIEEIAQARKAQGLTLVRSLQAVIVWADEPSTLLKQALAIHDQLLRFFWQIVDGDDQLEEETSPEEVFNRALVKSQFKMASADVDASATSSSSSMVSHISRPLSMCETDHVSITHSASSGHSSCPSTWGNSSGQIILQSASSHALVSEKDVESAAEIEERQVVFVAPIQHGLATLLAFTISCLAIRQAFFLCLLDGEWVRMTVVIVTPLIFGLVMFLADNIVGILVMIFGPVRQLQENSRYYSGKRPSRLEAPSGKPLPHITIQMPVYKESLVGVLRPSFESIKEAIRTYELQGGSASILVSEDGIAAINDEKERMARIAYYEENNITWIGRPKHGDDGFVRQGRFKKASNLNFTYEVMERVNMAMQSSHPQLFASVMLSKDGRLLPRENPFASPEERANFRALYDQALQGVLASIHPRACGAGHAAMGQFILLIDSDTRIPEDCLLDAASELTQSPDVGILQHCSGVMYVSTSFFEQAIGYFTNMINFAITYAVSNGDVSPFMGHNAYLRWSAMQEIARTTYDDKGALQSYKIWSDEHVSEDFVMSLDMLDRGYIVRWATYANGMYQEGVSLTCTDELNRWQKYAWGVSEMLFNKIHQWWRKGPITALFWRFICGKAPVHAKFASISYCLSYYAIALSVPGCIALTLIKGWVGFASMDVSTTFEVFVVTIIVFMGGCTVAYTLVQYRAGRGAFLHLAWQRIKYLPFMVFFFGGLPYHILLALLAHILNINMTWGATIKDWASSNVFAELPELFTRYWCLFVFWLAILTGITICTTSLVPLPWQLSGPYDLFPIYLLGALHILYPFVLNPNLLRFSF